MTIKEALSTLRIAFPRGEDLPPATMRLYEEKLADIGGTLLQETVHRIITTARFFPAIAEIRHMAASVAGVLPAGTEEALAIVRQADVREDIYRRDGTFAYTERYWRFPEGLPAPTMKAIYAAFEQCSDSVGRDGKDQFGWEQGFKASYQTAATAIERAALQNLVDSALPVALLTAKERP